MFSKISRLDRAIQAAQRHQVKANLPGELTDQILEEAQKIEARLTKLITDASTAKASGRYSQAGLNEKVATFQQEAAAAYAKLSKLPNFDEVIQGMEVDLINRSVTARQKNAPADGLLSHFEEREMRQYLVEKRKQAEAAQEPGKPYSDPVAELYMQCCKEYSANKEQVIRAITTAPFPISLLSEEIIDEGRKILRRTISPELATALESQRCLKAMYAELDTATKEIIDDPLRQSIRLEPHMLVADGEARHITG